jgi:hypothetical protein
VVAIGAALMSAVPLHAVYAPVPEQEQGREFTATLRAGLAYDSNLFGADRAATGSMIATFAPKLSLERSLSPTTFFSGGYGLTLDNMFDRPGRKLLDSHELALRLAHAFSKATTVDLNDAYLLSRNPESLLAGIPLNPDQSFQRNQADARFETPITAKFGFNAKARSVLYRYRNAALGRSLDRVENIYGAAIDYAVLPELKAVGELRHQDVFYRKLGETKNKRSDYAMAGFDYFVAKKASLSARAGVEQRHRVAERGTTLPYAEASGKFDYGRDSFVVAGYSYSLEETSDVASFNDTKMHRFFASVQQRVTALIAASAALTCEPSQLQGRRGVADVDENAVRTGVALSYQPGRRWTLSASYDYDRVRSDIASRTMTRHRCGVSVIRVF